MKYALHFFQSRKDNRPVEPIDQFKECFEAIPINSKEISYKIQYHDKDNCIDREIVDTLDLVIKVIDENTEIGTNFDQSKSISKLRNSFWNIYFQKLCRLELLI